VSQRRTAIALKIAGIALWGLFLIGMANWSNSSAAVVGAGLGTVALGVLVGRWWLLLVPIAPGAVIAIGTLVADPADFHEGSPGLWAAYVALWTITIAALLALGVAINRSAGILRTRRTRG
jgi:hypothetical protein